MDLSTSGSGLRARLHRRARRLEWFTVLWNVVEAVIALAAGILSASTALVAFGADSLIEVTAGGAVLWRLRRAGPEAAYREHGRAERRALFVVALTFFVLAAYVTFESVHALLSGEGPETSTVGLILATLSLVVMPALAYAKQKTGRDMGSKALQADAVETWVCAYLSFALLAGLGLHLVLGWWWADPVAALAMLPVIVWQGWETLGDARGDHGV